MIFFEQKKFSIYLEIYVLDKGGNLSLINLSKEIVRNILLDLFY